MMRRPSRMRSCANPRNIPLEPRKIFFNKFSDHISVGIDFAKGEIITSGINFHCDGVLKWGLMTTSSPHQKKADTPLNHAIPLFQPSSLSFDYP